MSKWEESGGLCGNQTLDGDDEFYISYAPGNSFGFMPMFSSDDGEPETALCIRGAGAEGRTQYLILNGDYRKEYEEAVPNGLKACKAVYEKHRESASSWSDEPKTGTDVRFAE